MSENSIYRSSQFILNTTKAIGDIHVLKATYDKALEEFVGNSKYGVFFPQEGPRSVGDEIAGGGFDGDMYFISRNPMLLEHFKPSELIEMDISRTNAKQVDKQALQRDHPIGQISHVLSINLVSEHTAEEVCHSVDENN